MRLRPRCFISPNFSKNAFMSFRNRLGLATSSVIFLYGHIRMGIPLKPYILRIRWKNIHTGQIPHCLCNPYLLWGMSQSLSLNFCTVCHCWPILVKRYVRHTVIPAQCRVFFGITVRPILFLPMTQCSWLNLAKSTYIQGL